MRAEAPNPALAILPGQFVRVRVTIGDEEVFFVPQAAVSTSDRGKSVWVVGPDNKAIPRPVEVGEWQGTSWAVKKGLSPGDKVIVDNLVKLRPGVPVAPHPPQAAAASAGRAQPGQPQGQAPAQAAPAKGTADGKS